MTIAPHLPVLPADLPAFELSDRARRQIEDRGITRSQLLRVILRPKMTIPGVNAGERRLSGYGLTVLMSGADLVSAVEIDGATSTNWDAWAVENAEFGDGDVFGADDLVAHLVTRGLQRPVRARRGAKTGLEPLAPVRIRQIPVQGDPGACRAAREAARSRFSPIPAPKPPVDPFSDNILLDVNPDLHEMILERTEGDFSRLVVNSWNDIEILEPFRR